jgi:D-lactate dehydrogenase
MEIAFFEINDWEVNILKKTLSKHKLHFFSTPLSERELPEIKNCEVVSIFIYSNVTSGIISQLPNLKIIATRSTGFNHIDLEACKKRKVIVSNVPTYGENTVAEHTFALLLSISRKIHKSYMRTMAEDYSIEGLEGFDLKDKTIGVIGTGHIGKHVIRIAQGFEMNILAYDTFIDKKLKKDYGVLYVSLDKLLRKSDIITLHIPSSNENRHLIDENAFNKMKKGAIIINTARGDLVDTKALLKSISAGKIGGAGLDVIEGEELIKEEKQMLHNHDTNTTKQIIRDHDLMRNESIVFTPHIAFYSREALERILKTSIDNITSFINKKPMNMVKV